MSKKRKRLNLGKLSEYLKEDQVVRLEAANRLHERFVAKMSELLAETDRVRTQEVESAMKQLQLQTVLQKALSTKPDTSKRKSKLAVNKNKKWTDEDLDAQEKLFASSKEKMNKGGKQS